MNTGTNKSSTTTQTGEMPTWSNVGSTDYNNMNTLLQTAPMNAAAQTFTNNGMTPAQTQATQTFQNIANGGGTNSNMDWATNALKGVAGQSTDTSQLQAIANGMASPGSVSASNWQKVYDKSGAPGAAEKFLTSTAEGGMLTNNPYIDKMVKDAQDSAADQTNRLFAAGGRYGSGTHQGVLANEMGKISNDLRFNNYNTERDRQLSAANAISGEQGNRLGLQGSAASGVAGVEGTNIGNKMTSDVNRGNIAQSIASIQSGDANRKADAANAVGGLGQSQLTNQMNAAGNAASTEQQGFQNILSMIGALPTIQDNKTYDADKQAGIGSTLDQLSQDQLNDIISQYGSVDMEDWNQLAALLSAGTTSAGDYGTQTATEESPMNILGALGTLFSGLSASDEKLKKNVKKVGKTPGGVEVVKYDLKEEVAAPKKKKKGILGVIAQDVAKKQPEAVKKTRGGLLAVDYSKLH